MGPKKNKKNPRLLLPYNTKYIDFVEPGQHFHDRKSCPCWGCYCWRRATFCPARLRELQTAIATRIREDWDNSRRIDRLLAAGQGTADSDRWRTPRKGKLDTSPETGSSGPDRSGPGRSSRQLAKVLQSETGDTSEKAGGDQSRGDGPARAAGQARGQVLSD